MNSVVRKSMRKVISLAAVAAITLAVNVTNGNRAAAAIEPSSQVIFSGIGVARVGFVSRVGFWVWCAADGNGPYARANACAGSIYVYRANVTVGVHGFMTEEADGTYTMHLFSNHPGELSATLHNVDPNPLHGPQNTVEFEVETEAGVSIGQSTTSVVNVTGPGN